MCNRGLTLILGWMLVICFSDKSNAAFFDQKYLKFSLATADYFGEANTSLNTATTGITGDGSFQIENIWFGVAMGISLATISGTETLLDGATEQSVNVTGLTYGAPITLIWNVIPVLESKVKPYIFVGGEFGVASLNIPRGVTYTELETSQTNLYTGYYFGAGMYLQVGTARTTGLFGEFRYKVLQTNAFGVSAFELNKVELAAGFSL
jgi:hypothetical protein